MERSGGVGEDCDIGGIQGRASKEGGKTGCPGLERVGGFGVLDVLEGKW